ncbi:P-loop containing nucleoside triphosphate hydrolase protein [Pavlovales sp. CCMP2436]|nr:P-loop containing nucleoside triphosphate hydrolase protein [Pavlovales sp. CCMP2436]
MAEPHFAGGFAGGHAAKQQAINRLRELNLESVNIKLPQIAVVGNQSVGKSTVMSALSGIPFPVDAKLTTRCATQVTMRKAETLQVSIGLSDQAEAESIILDSLEQVVSAIEAKTNELVPEHGAIETERFVKIEVSGPNCPNLTVIDLPGLIQTVDDGQIKGLVTRTMKSERTINLLIMRADVDPAGNEAFQLAREHDPLGVTNAGRSHLCALSPPISVPARHIPSGGRYAIVLT